MKTYKLTEITEIERKIVGEKAWYLSRLAQQGFSVPIAFVATGKLISEWDSASLWLKAKEILPVAVRSSSSLEDGKDFSNAGRFPTYLNIKDRESFVKALADIASYGDDKHPMGIIIQKMVNADFSGVCFTKDPLSPGKVLVEASHGRTDEVTSGQHTDISEEVEINSASENQDLVKRVEKECLKVSEGLGFDADIEWAIGKDGKFYFLQARPITATQYLQENIDSKGDFESDCFTASNIQEMLPGALTPMTQRLVVGALDKAMRQTLENAHVYEEGELKPGKGLACFNGHAYFDLTTIYGMEKRILGATKEGVNLTIIGASHSDLPDSKLIDASIARKFENLVHYLWMVLTSFKAISKAKKDLRKFQKSDPKLPLKQAIHSLKEDLRYFEGIWEDHHLTTLFAGSLTGTLTLISRDHTHDEGRSAGYVAMVLSTVKGSENAKIEEELEKIRAGLVKEGFTSKEPEEIAQHLANHNYRSAFLFDKFIAEFGHRSAREGELASIPWRMNSLPICQGLADEKVETPKDKKAIKEAKKALLNGTDWFESLCVHYILHSVKKAVLKREKTRDIAIKGVDCLRQRLLGLGRLLKSQDVIEEPDDIFYLLPEELFGLEEKIISFKHTVSARKRLKAYQESLRLPSISIGIPKPQPLQTMSKSATLKGSIASKGQAEGRAFIVNSVEDYSKIEPGDIVIAPYADTGLIPFMGKMGGLVIELGSILSHACVVARELSLPVLSYPNARKTIKNGARLILDADEGTIVITENNS